ncbi:MAG: site-2 protease family protein, partial [Gemmataceae bacterium]
TALTPGPGDLPSETLVYHKRLALLAGKPVTFHILRKTDAPDAKPTEVIVPPAFRRNTGVRMRMGEIVATRKNSPSDPSITAAPLLAGDQITDVEFTIADGTKVVYSASSGANPTALPGKKILPLDPIQLPLQLNRWADATPGPKKVLLTVMRDIDHTRKPVTLELNWDERGRHDLTPAVGANYPQAINGLGIAYRVLGVVEAVDPAAGLTLQPGDTVTAVRFQSLDDQGKSKTSPWQEMKPHQWAFVEEVLQAQAPHEAILRVQRQGTSIEVPLTTKEDPTMPADDRGLELAPDLKIMMAGSIGEALTMGFQRTVRSIQTIYMNLSAMAFGRVSIQTMSGPITLARASYIIAGQSVWKLMLLLALISINLAVVNFLPIPLLDGGHMMFLIYEGLRGKPAPESVQTVLTYIGLGMVGLMMLFVIGLDLWRLITG